MIEVQNEEQKQAETIDIKAILFKYFRFWHYFLLSFLDCLFCRKQKTTRGVVFHSMTGRS